MLKQQLLSLTLPEIRRVYSDEEVSTQLKNRNCGHQPFIFIP